VWLRRPKFEQSNSTKKNKKEGDAGINSVIWFILKVPAVEVHDCKETGGNVDYVAAAVVLVGMPYDHSSLESL